MVRDLITKQVQTKTVFRNKNDITKIVDSLFPRRRKRHFYFKRLLLRFISLYTFWRHRKIQKNLPPLIFLRNLPQYTLFIRPSWYRTASLNYGSAPKIFTGFRLYPRNYYEEIIWLHFFEQIYRHFLFFAFMSVLIEIHAYFFFVSFSSHRVFFGSMLFFLPFGIFLYNWLFNVKTRAFLFQYIFSLAFWSRVEFLVYICIVGIIIGVKLLRSSFTNTHFFTVNLSVPKQYLFPAPGSPVMEGVLNLHHDILFILCTIMGLVIWIMGALFFYFKTDFFVQGNLINNHFAMLEKCWQVVYATLFLRNFANLKQILQSFSHYYLMYPTVLKRKLIYRTHYPRHDVNWYHATKLEIVWTVVPALLLIIVALPSFALLYGMDDFTKPAVTLKVTGNQWFWTYEYANDFQAGDKKMDSMQTSPLAHVFDYLNYANHLNMGRTFIPQITDVIVEGFDHWLWQTLLADNYYYLRFLAKTNITALHLELHRLNLLVLYVIKWMNSNDGVSALLSKTATFYLTLLRSWHVGKSINCDELQYFFEAKLTQEQLYYKFEKFGGQCVNKLSNMQYITILQDFAYNFVNSKKQSKHIFPGCSDLYTFQSNRLLYNEIVRFNNQKEKTSQSFVFVLNEKNEVLFNPNINFEYFLEEYDNTPESMFKKIEWSPSKAYVRPVKQTSILDTDAVYYKKDLEMLNRARVYYSFDTLKDFFKFIQFVKMYARSKGCSKFLHFEPEWYVNAFSAITQIFQNKVSHDDLKYFFGKTFARDFDYAQENYVLGALITETIRLYDEGCELLLFYTFKAIFCALLPVLNAPYDVVDFSNESEISTSTKNVFNKNVISTSTKNVFDKNIINASTKNLYDTCISNINDINDDTKSAASYVDMELFKKVLDMLEKMKTTVVAPLFQSVFSDTFVKEDQVLKFFNDSTNFDISDLNDEHFVRQNDNVRFDSYMTPEEDLIGDRSFFRLLSVDRISYLPIMSHVRLLVSASDVLHSWAIPALAIKIDACPGRLNQIATFIQREGDFYGQCSEICGVNHGFMPIHVRAVFMRKYVSFFQHLTFLQSFDYTDFFIKVNSIFLRV